MASKILVAVVIAWAPDRAAAYCIAHSCDPDAVGGDECQRDARTGCSIDGRQLFRPDGCLHFAVEEGAAQRAFGLSDAEFTDAIQGAFDAWSSVDCDGSGPPSIEAQALVPAPIARPFACASDQKYNADVWLVRDDLSSVVTTNSGATAGTTHTSLVDDTGEVYDTDVSLNELWFLVQDEADVMDYLHVVAMHEAGHVLGLAHSQDEDALMYRDYRVSRDRTLTEDDVEGICALYPPMDLACEGRELPASAIDSLACSEARSRVEPDQGPDDAGHDMGSTGGCHVTPGQGGKSDFSIAALACMALFCFAERRRRRS